MVSQSSALGYPNLSYVHDNVSNLQENSTFSYKYSRILRNSQRNDENTELAKSKRLQLKYQKYFKNRIEQLQYYVKIIKYKYKKSRRPIVEEKNFMNGNQQMILVFYLMFDSFKDIILENRL